VFSAAGRQDPIDDLNIDQSSRDRAEAIASLYFPSLKGEFLALDAAAWSHAKFTLEQVTAIGADVNKWMVEKKPTFGTEAAVALRPLSDASAALRTKARSLIESDFDLP